MTLDIPNVFQQLHLARIRSVRSGRRAAMATCGVSSFSPGLQQLSLMRSVASENWKSAQEIGSDAKGNEAGWHCLMTTCPFGRNITNVVAGPAESVSLDRKAWKQKPQNSFSLSFASFGNKKKPISSQVKGKGPARTTAQMSDVKRQNFLRVDHC